MSKCRNLLRIMNEDNSEYYLWTPLRKLNYSDDKDSLDRLLKEFNSNIRSASIDDIIVTNDESAYELGYDIDLNNCEFNKRLYDEKYVGYEDLYTTNNGVKFIVKRTEGFTEVYIHKLDEPKFMKSNALVKES